MKAPAKKKPAKPSQTALVLINPHSGTVRTRGVEAVQALVRERLEKRYPGMDVELVKDDIEAEIAEALKSGKYHTIIAGGGDGTLSATAMALEPSGVTMGALPLGTMNLFVRALGFSVGLEKALDELAEAKPQDIDVGFVNGKLFLHQVSFGLQPRMARLREKIGYRSRLTKKLSGLRALAAIAADPKQVRINIDVDGEQQSLKVPLVIVSNNRLGSELNFSLQSTLTDGELGLYALREFSLLTLLRLARDHLANRLIVNPALDMRTARKISISPRHGRMTSKKPKGLLTSIDGEVTTLAYPVSITLKPKALKVLSAKAG